VLKLVSVTFSKMLFLFIISSLFLPHPVYVFVYFCAGFCFRRLLRSPVTAEPSLCINSFNFPFLRLLHPPPPPPQIFEITSYSNSRTQNIWVPGAGGRCRRILTILHTLSHCCVRYTVSAVCVRCTVAVI